MQRSVKNKLQLTFQTAERVSPLRCILNSPDVGDAEDSQSEDGVLHDAGRETLKREESTSLYMPFQGSAQPPQCNAPTNVSVHEDMGTVTLPFGNA